MCGIFGIFAKKAVPEKERLVHEAISHMNYRGPDEFGFYEDESMSMAVCRLSIVDVSGGHQPHVNDKKTIAVVCNGEIYNHRELRDRLVAKGHQFKTQSDTEVILHLYEEKKKDLLYDLSGMFAFALWDRERQALFLGRDRVGIKPLYIYSDDRIFAFSSEMSTLIGTLNLSADLVPEKVWEFFSYGFPVDNRQTVHRRIRRLMPGEACMVSGASETFFTYWSPAYMNGGPREGELSLKRVVDLYGRSIREHFVSEVPAAVMLSGGLDSTSIALFAHKDGLNLPAVTIGYDGNFPGDERDLAKEVAGLLDIHIHDICLTYCEYHQAFGELMHFCDEPVADIAAIPQWEIFKQTRTLGFKVLENGLGGDEVFYGYGVWNEASELFVRGAYQPYFEIDDVSGFFHHPAYRASRRFLDRCAISCFKAAGKGCDSAICDRFDGESLTGVDRIYHLLFKTWLPNNCLLLADRLSMAHSIELRVPMLDHRLIDYIHSLPQGDRFFGSKGKVILKNMLKDLLPARVIDRPKQGFTPPGKYMKEMISAFMEEIFDNKAVRDFFMEDEMKKHWKDDTYLEIWFRLLVFSRWYHHTFAREGRGR